MTKAMFFERRRRIPKHIVLLLTFFLFLYWNGTRLNLRKERKNTPYVSVAEQVCERMKIFYCWCVAPCKHSGSLLVWELRYRNLSDIVSRNSLRMGTQLDHLLLLLPGIYNPLQVWAASLWRFLNHTQGRTTVGRNPLDEWSARRRDLYLTIHTTLTTENHD